MKKHQVDVGNAQVVPRDDYVATLEAIIAQGFCPFCEEHLLKHHRNPILYKSEYWLVTENTWPYGGTQHHFLLIARAHVEATEVLSPEAWADFHEVYRLLVTRYNLKGATLMLRSGSMQITGASVNHLHAQLIVGSPRAEGAEPIKALVGFNCSS